MANTELIGYRLYRRSNRYIIALGAPARPAGYVSESQYMCGFYPRAELLAAYQERGDFLGGLRSVDGLNPELLTLDGPDYVRQAYFDNGSFPSGAVGYICGEFATQVQQEATEATDTVYAEPPTAGWNAAAVSDQAFFAQGRVKFRVEAGKRFIVGLGNNVDPLLLGAGVKFIGWIIDSDYVRVLWRGYGDEGSLSTGGGTDASYVPYDDTTTYTVELLGGNMTFSRDDGYGTSWTYPLPIVLDQPDVWMLSAALWEPGSWVDGIEVVAYNTAALSLPALTVKGGDGVAPSDANATLPHMRSFSRAFTNATSSLPRMKSLGGRKIAQAEAEMPAMAMHGQEELELTGLAPRSMRGLPRLSGSGYMLTGTVGRGAPALPSMLVRGQEGNVMGDGAGSLPLLEVISATLPPDEVRMYGIAAAAVTVRGFYEVLVTMDSAGNISDVTAVAILLDGELADVATISDAYITSALLNALMNSQALTGTDVGDGAPGEVWAVSLAEDSASSTFENYAFNSFGVIGGQAYGVKEDGLYTLSGNTDAGDPIRASVSFGKQDFRTKTEKQMNRAYMGASSTGTMYLKIVANGAEYIYAARTSSTELKQQRFDVGRGLKANYFTFELFNKDGGDFELDSVTFVAAEFKRRI